MHRLYRDDSKDLLGIELPVNVVVEFHLKDGTVRRYRFIGRVDGLAYSPTNKKRLQLHENKTGSRIGEEWSKQWTLSHQVTGYCVGLSTMHSLDISRGIIFGTAIPLPRSYDFGGLSADPVERDERHIQAWLRWFWSQVQKIEAYEQDILSTPQSTGNCYNYFRICSLMPFCDSPRELQEEILDDMEDETWNPLHDKSGD